VRVLPPIVNQDHAVMCMQYKQMHVCTLVFQNIIVYCNALSSFLDSRRNILSNPTECVGLQIHIFDCICQPPKLHKRARMVSDSCCAQISRGHGRMKQRKRTSSADPIHARIPITAVKVDCTTDVHLRTVCIILQLSVFGLPRLK
jgi:hypothetical protein